MIKGLTINSSYIRLTEITLQTTPVARLQAITNHTTTGSVLIEEMVNQYGLLNTCTKNEEVAICHKFTCIS